MVGKMEYPAKTTASQSSVEFQRYTTLKSVMGPDRVGPENSA